MKENTFSVDRKCLNYLCTLVCEREESLDKWISGFNFSNFALPYAKTDFLKFLEIKWFLAERNYDGQVSFLSNSYLWTKNYKIDFLTFAAKSRFCLDFTFGKSLVTGVYWQAHGLQNKHNSRYVQINRCSTELDTKYTIWCYEHFRQRLSSCIGQWFHAMILLSDLIV